LVLSEPSGFETGKQFLAQIGELPLVFFRASLQLELAFLIQHSQAEDHEDRQGVRMATRNSGNSRPGSGSRTLPCP